MSTNDHRLAKSKELPSQYLFFKTRKAVGNQINIVGCCQFIMTTSMAIQADNVNNGDLNSVLINT